MWRRWWYVVQSAFVENRSTRDRLVSEGIVTSLLDLAIRNAGTAIFFLSLFRCYCFVANAFIRGLVSYSSYNCTDGAEQARLAAYGLLCEIWLLFPDQVDSKEDGCRLVLSILKKVCTHGIFITSAFA